MLLWPASCGLGIRSTNLVVCREARIVRNDTDADAAKTARQPRCTLNIDSNDGYSQDDNEEGERNIIWENFSVHLPSYTELWDQTASPGYRSSVSERSLSVLLFSVDLEPRLLCLFHTVYIYRHTFKIYGKLAHYNSLLCRWMTSGSNS